MRRFLAFKSFGDAVIACRHLREFSSAGDDLLCAEHLRPLIKALGYSGPTNWMNCGERGVPAFFDIRKHGAVAAGRSAARLREAIQVATEPDDTLVFDRIGWRQRFLATGRKSVDIVSGRRNIYLDYEAFFGRPIPGKSVQPSVSGRLGIFPDSRVATKEIPAPLVKVVAGVLREEGRDVQILRAGEGRELNSFEALIDAVASFSAIVSADSLPAHLAEYFGIPVYVFSPVPNDYWLPKSTLEKRSHSLFGDSLECLRYWVSTGSTGCGKAAES